MNLNDLLRSKNIDPETVLVLRHHASEPELNKALPWLAAEKPDVFNAYQQTQGERAERAMARAKFVASFIGCRAGKALFIGLYDVGGSKPITRAEYWRIPAYIEMKALGMTGWTAQDSRSSRLWFDLRLNDFYAAWKGKLIIGWPPPERSWWRRAHSNVMPVLAVLEESALDAEMPEWEDICLTWEQLKVLPTPWKSKLSEWRAIYYIFDESDGKGYVGSAYGGITCWAGGWVTLLAGTAVTSCCGSVSRHISVSAFFSECHRTWMPLM